MEIVMICGFPGSGKSTMTKEYNGYTILSRDELGGSYKTVLKTLELHKNTESVGIVLDNLHINADNRKPFIDFAQKNGIPIRAVWLDCDIETCFINVLRRTWRTHGEISFTGQDQPNDPHTFPPAVLFSARKKHEIPTIEEGFDKVDIVASPKSVFDKSVYVNKALFFDIDGTLRKTDHLKYKYPTNTDEVEPYKDIATMRRVIDEYKDFILVGVSNQSGVSKGTVTPETVRACMDKTKDLLGLDIDIKWCPHRPAPITCYCRKPQSGLGIHFIEKYKIDPSQSIMIGDRTTDCTFARRLGMPFIHTDKFFE
jgi:histidinol-phosphate phosphatase family protein